MRFQSHAGVNGEALPLQDVVYTTWLAFWGCAKNFNANLGGGRVINKFYTSAPPSPGRDSGPKEPKCPHIDG